MRFAPALLLASALALSACDAQKDDGQITLTVASASVRAGESVDATIANTTRRNVTFDLCDSPVLQRAVGTEWLTVSTFDGCRPDVRTLAVGESTVRTFSTASLPPGAYRVYLRATADFGGGMFERTVLVTLTAP